MGRLALLVGCNYAGTQNELRGCINDVVDMRETLIQRFGFDESDIVLLTDERNGSSYKVMPTGANIKAAINRMINRARSGDVMYFHFSGHGTRISYGDAIVPCDFNLITYLDFRVMVDRVPKGATLTILSDSCFSGGLIDKEKEQIGPNITHRDTTTYTFNENNDIPIRDLPKPRFIPLEFLLQHFQSLTRIDSSDIGIHLLESFGDEASHSFTRERASFENLKPDGGILLSGCQANETSKDMGGARPHGAFSNAVLEVLQNIWPSLKRNMSYWDVVMCAREGVAKVVRDQHPCLYCIDQHVGLIFLRTRQRG